MNAAHRTSVSPFKQFHQLFTASAKLHREGIASAQPSTVPPTALPISHWGVGGKKCGPALHWYTAGKNVGKFLAKCQISAKWTYT